MSTVAIFIAVGFLLIGMVIWSVISRQRADAAWRQFASELVGAEFQQGNLFRRSKVEVPVNGRMASLDEYAVSSGDSSTVYTRLRAPLQNAGGLEFTIARRTLISNLDKLLGTKEIAIGDTEMDRLFVVRGNQEIRVRALFANPTLRRLIGDEKSIHVRVRNSQLNLEIQGSIRDVRRLKSLFELFKAILLQLDT